MLDIHRLIITLILGVVEGLTEFLPVSSTGHMILIGNILNYSSDDLTKIFTVIVQLGAILAVVVIFWNKLYEICVFCVKNIFIKRCYRVHHLCIQHILLGLFPITVLGAIFYEKIRLILEPICVVYGLVVGSVFLLIGEVFFSKVCRVSNTDNITYLQAFLIGCFQCLAFWPGFSRSGATIGGGLLVGLSRRVSLEFSFFLAIPTILGAVILTVYHCGSYINNMDCLLLISGSLVSFIMALFTVKIFLKIIQNVSLIPFVVYRFLLAGSIYWGLII